jgi:hydrogenase/urease accessory protein HupE
VTRRRVPAVRLSAVVVIAAAVLLSAGPVGAHDFKPALVVIKEQAPDSEAPVGAQGTRYDVVWRMPIEAAGDDLHPVFPEGSARLGASLKQREGDMLVERFGLFRPGGLGGGALALGGRSAFVSEVLVRLELMGGQVVTGRLAAQNPNARFEFPHAPTRSGIAATYLRLGVEHILTGLDHLLFVLALVLLAPAAGAILRAVTAFTVAHSITLGLAALGLARVPQAPVEAAIALSIVLVARELALRAPGASLFPPSSAPPRAPTAMAFGFGLLHGLGFAGALREVGLPAGEIPLSLFTFNVGVELGQLGFVVLVLLVRKLFLAMVAGRRPAREPLRRLPQFLAAAPARLIGGLGVFWLIDRIVGFWD